MGLPQGQAYDKKKKKDEAGKGNWGKPSEGIFVFH
jgi:hypothetical protein